MTSLFHAGHQGRGVADARGYMNEKEAKQHAIHPRSVEYMRAREKQFPIS
jgi:hypothetical protein